MVDLTCFRLIIHSSSNSVTVEGGLKNSEIKIYSISQELLSTTPVTGDKVTIVIDQYDPGIYLFEVNHLRGKGLYRVLKK